jgi:hypothetical protein
MVTLEQIKLLESRIVRAIDVVNRLTEENLRLKKRNEDLEELAERLKDEKSRVEAGIVSALDRLNQFEDAIERSLAASKPPHPPAAAPIPHSVPGPVIPPVPPAPVVRHPQPAPTHPAAPAGESDNGGSLPAAAYAVEELESAEPDKTEPDEAELDIF